MTRRIATSRFTRTTGRRSSVVAGAVLSGWLAGALLVSPAAAEDEISVQPDHIVVAEPGSLTDIASEPVPIEFVGKTCGLRVVAQNGASVHPGNVLVVVTGDSKTVVEGVEDNPDGSVVANENVALGETISLQLQMGPDGISSLGFTVGFDCVPDPVDDEPETPAPTVLPAQQTPPPESSVPATAPPTTAPPATAPPASELPPAPPARATVAAPTFTG
ncbi:MAG: hypothetical protein OEV40_23235 [Acidimicrobiia bacterium]|nr:hypothetical protein [Acidimicrobiia bacterium]